MFCLSCWVCFYSADSPGSKIRAPDYSARWRFGSGWIDDGADFRNSVRGKAEAEAQQPGTSMVLVKAIKGGSDLLYDSFYLFHGNLRFPVTKLTTDELHGARPAPPVLGVCVERDFPVVQEVYRNVQTQFTRAQFILWRVDAE